MRFTLSAAFERNLRRDQIDHTFAAIERGLVLAGQLANTGSMRDGRSSPSDDSSMLPSCACLPITAGRAPFVRLYR